MKETKVGRKIPIMKKGYVRFMRKKIKRRILLIMKALTKKKLKWYC